MSTATATPKSQIVKITPKMAAEWLEQYNTHNRDLRQHTVDQISAAIKRGEWRLNNDAITFDSTGRLANGQHRLWAIVDSDTAVECMVLRGVDDDAQLTMDRGGKRNLRDHLKMSGESNWTILAAAINIKWRQENGLERTTSTPTGAQALATFKKHSKLRNAVGPATRIVRKFKVSPAAVTVCYYDFAAIDATEAENMWQGLMKGEGLNPGDPVLALRRWLENQQAAQGKAPSAVLTQAVFIKTWNAIRDGRHVENIQWRGAGVNAEKFPQVRK